MVLANLGRLLCDVRIMKVINHFRQSIYMSFIILIYAT